VPITVVLIFLIGRVRVVIRGIRKLWLLSIFCCCCCSILYVILLFFKLEDVFTDGQMENGNEKYAISVFINKWSSVFSYMFFKNK